MQQAELTLAAAIRDSTSKRLDAQAKAIRNLAPALLEELGEPGPLWRATARHDHGDEVLACLRTALDGDDPMLAAMAATGMGLLGEPEVLERTALWLLTEGDDEAVVFKRQCALIAMSYVGTAAPEHDDEARRIRAEVLERVRILLRAEHADVRFQAAVALVEVGGDAVEHDLVDALATETHEEVRENLVAAISRLDPPGEAACKALVAILDDEDQGWRPIGFEAAMALAAARRPQAGPRLLAALERRGERDLALEALAALGRSAPADAIERTHRLARGLRTPGITRVRAAYALARMIAPSGAGSTDHVNPGTAMLRRLAWHPRPAVREAVADALTALRELGE